MTLGPRAATVIALACALTTAADARDLFILQAGGVRDSGHDAAGLIDDFLSQQGAFRALTLQPSYTATLDYLGIQNAIRMQASAFGTQVVLQIPSTGFSKTFTGTSPANVQKQVRDFLEGTGAHQLAKFLEKTNAHAKLAALDGNPRSTTALFAANAFDRFGMGPQRTRAGDREEDVARLGHFDLAVRAGGGAVDVSHFHSLSVTDAALTLGGDRDRVGLYLSLLGQYRNYDGADIYDAGLELGIPITVARPGGSIPVRWSLTPVVQTGGSGSRDLLAGGFLVGGGCVSSFGWSIGPLELTVADEMLYYGGVPLGTIRGVRIETELDRWITRNGIKLALYPLAGDWLSIEGGIKASHFLGSGAAVDSYATPFAGVDVKAFDLLRLRIGWESDFGKHDYAAHVGRLDLGFEF